MTKPSKRWLTFLLALILCLQAVLTSATITTSADDTGRDLSGLVPDKSILTGVDTKFYDGQDHEVALDDVKTTDTMDLRYHWALPDGIVHAGDYFTFKLPDIVNSQPSAGNLLCSEGSVIATYVVDDQNQVTLTFNQTAAELDNVKGDFHFSSTGIKFDTIGEKKIEIPISQHQTTEVPVTIIPDHTVALKKTGKQVGDTADVDWNLDVNSKHETLTDGYIDEQLPDMLKLTGVEIHTAIINPDGSLKSDVALKEGTDFKVDGTKIELLGDYQKTDAALKVTVHTTLKDPTRAYNYTTIQNTASLHYGGSDQPTVPTNTAYITINYHPQNDWFDKTFGGIDSRDGGDYLWYVEYNKDFNQIPAGTVITDTPDANQTLDPDNFQIMTMQKNGDQLAPEKFLDPSNYTVDFSNGQLKVTLNKDFNQPIQMIYGVKVTDPKSGMTLANSIEDNHGHTGKGTGTITHDETPSLRKQAVSGDTAAHTIDWQVDINDNQQTLHNYVMTDTLSERINNQPDPSDPDTSLVAGSLKLVDQNTKQTLSAGTDYRFESVSGTQFKVSLIGNYAESTHHLVMTYTTKYGPDPDGNTTWVNKVSGPDYDANADYTPQPDSGDRDNKGGFVETDGGMYLQWEITANAKQMPIQDGKIVDQIESLQRFKSVTVYEKGEHGEENVDVTNKVNIDRPTDTNDQALTVHLPEGSTKVYFVVVQTTFSDPTTAHQETGYRDTAHFINGGDDESLPGNPLYPVHDGDMINKSGKQNQQNSALVDWEVNFNEVGATLNNAVITDVASPNQIVDLASLKIYRNPLNTSNYNNGEQTLGEPLQLGQDYTVDSQINGETGETITSIHLKDTISIPLKVVYQAKIDSNKALDTVTNNVRVDAKNVQTISKEQVASVDVTVTGGSASGTTGTLELEKRDQTTKAPLQGAEFTLIPDANPNKARSVTTDQDGNATVDNLLSGNYHLIETKAPAGYDIDPAYAGEGKEIQLAFKDDSQPLTYTVYNSKHVLPRTGGIGQAIALIIGSLLLSLAIALITWRMKRQVG